MKDWMQAVDPGDEVNVVLARGLSPDALTDGIRRLRREPRCHGAADGWAWAVHPVHDWEAEDYDDVDYLRLCSDGTELVVFEREPCSAKSFPPAFSYYRDGRLILHFSFEDLQQRVGDNPDHLSPELLEAGLIGPDAVDDELRLVRTLADFFHLPSPPLSAEVAAR
ncbi:DUF6461 domain-containing protein [Streptomyces sp. NPDC018693]|uniref:DUF6461 domain-containing protein n=1 Tax=unclassified Streptomyces TaxID=2593676 RepID=UPI0037B1D23E